MEEYEIDLRKVFLLLWNKKWIIIGLVIIAMLGAFIHGFILTDRTYESRAEVLIIPPLYTEIEVSEIPPPTYMSIASSQLTFQEIIEKLDLRDEENELIAPRSLERMVDLEIMDEEDQGVLALIFEATNTDPDLPSRIVNTWAEIFMEDVLEIRQAEIEDIANVITRRYEETEEKLDKTLEELRAFQEKARLDRLEARKEAYKSQVERNEEELLSLTRELGKKTAQLDRIGLILSDMQDEDGTWLGGLTNEEISEMRPEMYEAVKNYRGFREKLFSFRKENDIQAKTALLDFHETELSTYRGQKSELEQNYNLVKKQMEKIEKVLAREHDRWELEKSLSEDAFWDRIFSPDEIEVLSQLVLTEEIVNPIYSSLRDQKADLEVEFGALPGQIDYYDNIIEETEERISQIREEILTLEEQEEEIRSDLDLYSSLYSQRQSNFEDLKDEYFSLGVGIEKLETKKEFLKIEQEQIEESLDKLESQFWDFEIQEERLERKVSDYESTYKSLSRRAEDARLAMAEQTSDVRFISQAVPPGEPVGRGTVLNMALAGVLAGMIGVFGVFFREFLKGDEKKEQVTKETAKKEE